MPTISAQPYSSLVDPTSSAQAFCLRWNNYQSNLTAIFAQLLQNEQFVDVTLSCDGAQIKAHKMILSACSPYFATLFADNPCKHPIIILKDVKFAELKSIIEFMYRGEIDVCQNQIGALLQVAELLKVRGLADVSADQKILVETASPSLTPATETTLQPPPPPPPTPINGSMSPFQPQSDDVVAVETSAAPAVSPPPLTPIGGEAPLSASSLNSSATSPPPSLPFDSAILGIKKEIGADVVALPEPPSNAPPTWNTFVPEFVVMSPTRRKRSNRAFGRGGVDKREPSAEPPKRMDISDDKIETVPESLESKRTVALPAGSSTPPTAQQPGSTVDTLNELIIDEEKVSFFSIFAQ